MLIGRCTRKLGPRKDCQKKRSLYKTMAPNQEQKAEQRYVIKHYCKIGKTATEVFDILKTTYGDNTLARATVFRWHAAFSKEGRTSATLEGGPGAPITKLTEITRNTGATLLADDPRMTLRELANILQVSLGSAHRLVTKILGMTRVCARWIPHSLTEEHKAERVRISKLLLRRWHRNREWFDDVVTCDESWVYHYDPKTKRESTKWVLKGGAPPRKVRAQKSKQKVMVVSFFDQRGMIYTHYCEAGRNINTEYYMEIITQLIRVHIPRKRPEYQGGKFKLHQDNARPHVSKKMIEFFEKKKIELVPHPPYSPDLAPCDFFLFPTLKNMLKGIHFQSNEEIISTVKTCYRRLSKNGFQSVYEAWSRRWKKCIALGGDYFEGDRNVDA